MIVTPAPTAACAGRNELIVGADDQELGRTHRLAVGGDDGDAARRRRRGTVATTLAGRGRREDRRRDCAGSGRR